MYEQKIKLCKEIAELSDTLAELIDGFGVTVSVQICDIELSEVKGFLGDDYYDSLHRKLIGFKKEIANSASEHIKNMIDRKLSELRCIID